MNKTNMENKQTKRVETKKKVFTGIVISDKAEKTITVKVDSHKSHPTYNKRFLKSSKFLVHDEKEIANVGDLVEIMECRPLSKRKHFFLVKVKQKAVVKG